jgi:hypothetical protein
MWYIDETQRIDEGVVVVVVVVYNTIYQTKSTANGPTQQGRARRQLPMRVTLMLWIKPLLLLFVIQTRSRHHSLVVRM